MAVIRRDNGDKKKAAKVLRESIAEAAGAPAPNASGKERSHLITPQSRGQNTAKAADVLHESLGDRAPASGAAPARPVLTPAAAVQDRREAAEILHAAVREVAGPEVAAAQADRAASADFPEVGHAFAAAAAAGFPDRNHAENAAQPPADLSAMTGVAGVVARGFQEMSREWMGLAQGRLQKNMEALNAVARCRSLQELMALQTRFLMDNVREATENNRRIAEVSMRVAREAAEAMSGTRPAKRA